MHFQLLWIDTYVASNFTTRLPFWAGKMEFVSFSTKFSLVPLLLRHY